MMINANIANRAPDILSVVVDADSASLVDHIAPFRLAEDTLVAIVVLFPHSHGGGEFAAFVCCVVNLSNPPRPRLPGYFLEDEAEERY